MKMSQINSMLKLALINFSLVMFFCNAFACDASPECVALSEAMGRFYDTAEHSVETSINIGGGQQRRFFTRQALDQFLRQNSSGLEAVLAQGANASSRADALISEFSRLGANALPSQLRELAIRIDDAVSRVNQYALFVHGFEQGPNGGLTGNGILWEVPREFRHLSDTAKKINYVNYDRLLNSLGGEKLEKLAQFSDQVPAIAKKQVDYLKRRVARSSQDGDRALAKTYSQDAADIERRLIVRASTSSAQGATGAAPGAARGFFRRILNSLR